MYLLLAVSISFTVPPDAAIPKQLITYSINLYMLPTSELLPFVLSHIQSPKENGFVFCETLRVQLEGQEVVAMFTMVEKILGRITDHISDEVIGFDNIVDILRG